MGQFASFASSNPQLMQMGGQMAGGMMGGKGGGKGGTEEGLAPEKSSGGFQDMAQNMDQLGQGFDNMADAQFAATEEYRKQRGQGLPETNKPQLQNVESAVSKLAGLFGSKPEKMDDKSANIDTQPAMTEDSTLDLKVPGMQEDDEDTRMAKLNALQGLIG